jgi:DnaJ-class molecular chaperone
MADQDWPSRQYAQAKDAMLIPRADRCKRCDGSGRLWRVEAKEWPYGYSEPSYPPTPITCSRCGGTGTPAKPLNGFASLSAGKFAV